MDPTRSILLINPNTSERTTAMMLAVAQPLIGEGSTIRGATATLGSPMILDEATLKASAEEVIRIALAEEDDADAIVVAAFGDPGVERLRVLVPFPVVGIGEAAIREAASGDRRFGIATTTPALVRAIGATVRRLGLHHLFTGVRVPDTDPLALAADPARQDEVLACLASACITHDGANAVVIGGGPLSESAARLSTLYPGALVQPIPSALRALQSHPSGLRSSSPMGRAV